MAAMSRRTKQRTGMGRVLLRVATGLVFAFLMLPLLVLFPISFSSGSYLRFPPPGFSLKWYARYFSDVAWIDATYRSLQIGTATTVLAHSSLDACPAAAAWRP